MIHVFLNGRGAGKTKELIKIANSRVSNTLGNVVYINDDLKPLFQLDKRIRFITTEEFQINSFNSFYGFLCGILSEDYDIEAIYIDGLSNIVSDRLDNAAFLFLYLEGISQTRHVDIFINMSYEGVMVPEFMKKYVA